MEPEVTDRVLEEEGPAGVRVVQRHLAPRAVQPHRGVAELGAKLRLEVFVAGAALTLHLLPEYTGSQYRLCYLLLITIIFLEKKIYYGFVKGFSTILYSDCCQVYGCLF